MVISRTISDKKSEEKGERSSQLGAGRGGAWAAAAAESAEAGEAGTEAGCLDVVLQPGEVLYYPERWWHRTGNADADADADADAGADAGARRGADARGGGTGSPILSLSRSVVTPANARAG